MRSVTANGRSPPQKLSGKIDIKEDKAKVKSSCDGAGAFTSSLENTEIKVTFYILIKIKAKCIRKQPSVVPVDRILGRFVFSSLKLSVMPENAAANMTSMRFKRLPPSISSQMFGIIHCGAAPLKDT